jgi:endonuclease/exonuclease/phosphatase family metal-dependent hydrolase
VSKPDKLLSILTLNICGIPLFFGKRQRLQRIGQEIVKILPDVVLFQEIFVTFDLDILRQILASSGYYIYYQNRGVVIYGGLVIASRYPLVGIGYEEFSEKGLKLTPANLTENIFRKGFLWGVLQIGKRDITIVSTHLHLSPFDNPSEVANSQVAQIAWRTKKKGNVIVGGDFNSSANSSVWQVMKKAGFKCNEIIGGKTFSMKGFYPGWLCQLVRSKDSILDQIFWRGYIAGKDLTVVLDKRDRVTGTRLSDHMGLLVKFKI